MRAQDLLTRLAKIAAFDGAVRADENRRREPAHPVEVSRLPVRIEGDGRGDAEILPGPGS